MIKVTLLGDSIRRIGYGDRVAAELGDNYQVWQPDDNCRFAQYTLRGLFDWAGYMGGSHIVHWNNGLWDCCDILGDNMLFTPVDVYVDTMVRIASILIKRHKNVIFATSTPAAIGNIYNKNDQISKYNEALVPKLAEMGVVINDLWSALIVDVNRYIRDDDKIHLTEEGVDVCTEMVKNSIYKVAETIR
jgi:hypothetical protein